MKREILFRGKRIDNGEWVYGTVFYYKEENACYTINNLSTLHFTNEDSSFSGYRVNPKTVGQSTGLSDKNGVMIFQGDVLLSESWGSNARSKRKTHIVEWGRVGWLVSGYNGDVEVKPSLDVRYDWQVIGNIHDNPELSK